MWPQACLHTMLLLWHHSLCCMGKLPGAQGSKAQVGSVSFMPLGAIAWTLKQH